MCRVITFWTGSASSSSTTRAKSASGTAAGSPIPPRRRVTRLIRNAPGKANSAYQPTDFQMWLRFDVAELVRDHDPHLAGREAPVEERVPDHDPPARPDPLGLGVRERRLARDVLDPTGTCRRARFRSSCATAPQPRVVERGASLTRYGETNAKSATSPTNTGAARIHHQSADERARPITIPSATQSSTNSNPSASQPPRAACQ